MPIGNSSTGAAAGRNLLAVVALINVCCWHIASFRCAAKFGSYWGMRGHCTKPLLSNLSRPMRGCILKGSAPLSFDRGQCVAACGSAAIFLNRASPARVSQMEQFEKAEWLSLKEHPELNEKWVKKLITMEQNSRGFLQVAGVAAATFTLDGLRSAAWAANEATGKMKIENVGLMSPGDMGQAVAMQIKAK